MSPKTELVHLSQTTMAETLERVRRAKQRASQRRIPVALPTPTPTPEGPMSNDDAEWVTRRAFARAVCQMGFHGRLCRHGLRNLSPEEGR